MEQKQKKEAARIAKETQLHEDIEALIQLKADEEYLKNITFEQFTKTNYTLQFCHTLGLY